MKVEYDLKFPTLNLALTNFENFRTPEHTFSYSKSYKFVMFLIFLGCYFRMWLDHSSHHDLAGPIPARVLAQRLANHLDNKHGNNKQLSSWLYYESSLWLPTSNITW